MQKRLSRYGNSFALIIDKPILDLLSITEETVLKISIDGKTIVIAPQSNVSIGLQSPIISNDKQIQKSFDDAMQEYAPALKKLAKN